MFVTLIGTIHDSITQPIIGNALFEVAAAFEVVFGAAAVFLVGVIAAVGFTIAKEAFLDALLLIIAFESRFIACNVAVDLITEVIAVEFTVAPQRSFDAPTVITLKLIFRAIFYRTIFLIG